MSHYSPWVILLAPLIAAFLTALPRRPIHRHIYAVGLLLQVVAFVGAVRALFAVAGHGHEAIRLGTFPPGAQGTAIFSIDRLAAVMMVVITGVGALLYRYSIRYMQSEEGRARYHTLLSIAIVVLLCMVSSANLLGLFVFWQLLSFLLGLLPYNYAHPPTVKGAFRTFTILRLGDLCFLGGIILAYRWYGTLDFDQLFVRAKATEISMTLWLLGGIKIRVITAITLLIFVGAMSKSAQFPLHQWLPDFLYAPTPVCGFLHAGIINAGGFLLNRLAPLYGLSTAVLHVVFLVGLLTAFLGASTMLTQNDIKKTLGYSTVGQMGYMIMECGLGAFSLAIFHLIAHGLFKATIFLYCGSVIHAARQDPRLPNKDETEEPTEFSLLTWLIGFATTLVLPLSILLAIHGVLRIPLIDSQGTVIFLFFSWFTSSQAILTLYRLKAVASKSVAALMVLTLLLVVSTYLLAAEVFTHFLYPTPGEVAHYFLAAGLPDWLFDTMIVVTSLGVIMGWVLIYARSHGRSIRASGWIAKWIGVVQIQLYLLFMNRLYIDALWLGINRVLDGVTERLEKSRYLAALLVVLALALGAPAAVMAARSGGFSLHTLLFTALTLASACLLPLFPFHRVYVLAVTRTRGAYPPVLATVLPLVGFGALTYLLPRLPPQILGCFRLLALCGGLYAAFMAFRQSRMSQLIAYFGLAVFSILWWHLTLAGKVTPQAGIYCGAVLLVMGGLFYVLHHVRARDGSAQGEVLLDRSLGLARAMPRFAVLLALLVMAAAGLPPFGLFSGFVAMAFHPAVLYSGVIAKDMGVPLVIFFVASWSLFKMMQRFLFGSQRPDVLYSDLKSGEVAACVTVLVLMAALGLAPLGLGRGEAAPSAAPAAAAPTVESGR